MNRIGHWIKEGLRDVEIENRRFMSIMAMGGTMLLLWGAVFELRFRLRVPFYSLAALLCYAGSVSLFWAWVRKRSSFVYFAVSLACLLHHLYLIEINDYHPYFLVSTMLAFSLAALPMSGLGFTAGVILVPLLCLGAVCLLNPSEMRLLMFMGVGSISTIIFYLSFERHQLNEKSRADHKLLEAHRAQSVESAKMAALGEMAGGVAHEVNNPLMIISAKAEVLEMKLAKGDVPISEITEGLSSIRKTVERIVKIIRGLRSFARDATHDPLEAVNVNQLIAETLEFCEARFKKDGIRLVVDTAPSNLIVKCRATQISQVLLNLLLNSRDAVQALPDRWVRVQPEITPQNFLVIRVIDSGSGVAPELQEKIFQPFFTTKAVGKGTGLGLSVCKGILESHRGSIRLNSRNPRTEFMIELPLEETQDESPTRRAS